jgi:lysophospholipase L1-like esterase
VDKRWLYAGLLLTAAGVGLVHAFRGPKIRAGERLLLVGDSLAVGLAPPMKALAAESKVEFQSLALTGSRIDQWARSNKLTEKLTTYRPKLALISLGTNDAYGTGANIVQQTAAALETLLAKFRVANVDVAWIGPPKLPAAPSPAVLTMLKQSISSSHYFASDTLGIPRAPDGVHPTLRGYAGWAGAIWRWLS